MSTKAKRVALLARPGVAEQRLVEVLAGAGVDIVLQADPTQVEVAAVLGAQPDTLLVALDPPTEDALERLEAALDAPTVDVIFEEAALVVSREGWDAARWQRHLLAKLQGHGNVLPPTVGAEAPQAHAQAGSAPELEVPAPVEEYALPVETSDEATTVSAVAPEIELGLELELPVEAPTAPLATSIAWTLDPGPEAPSSQDDADLRLPEASADDLTLPSFETAAVQLPTDDVAMDQAAIPPLEFNPFDPVAAETSDSTEVPAAAMAVSDHSFATEPDPALSKEEQFKSDLASLELRIATMSLVEDTPVPRAVPRPENRRGAVLVLAGIGGPDAVRQLLGSLPTDFGRPVLVQQRLDGARYDRLVAQMQRATPLPVRLAESGQAVEPGTVYILPDGIGVSATGDALAFVEGGSDMLSALPAGDSAVLMLSGSDPAFVDAALSFGWSGGMVIGQSPDGCYDAAAATELVARGGTVAKPSEMGPRLAAHWHPSA